MAPIRGVSGHGANLTAPQTFNWTPGSSHTLGAPSPQGSGARFVYSGWSDGGAQTHTVTAPNTSTTYTANYAVQYPLTAQASPTAGGKLTADPDSPDGYYSNGTNLAAGLAQADKIPLPTLLGGVSVTINGAVSSPGSVQVVASSPGIFTVQYGVGDDPSS